MVFIIFILVPALFYFSETRLLGPCTNTNPGLVPMRQFRPRFPSLRFRATSTRFGGPPKSPKPSARKRRLAVVAEGDVAVRFWQAGHDPISLLLKDAHVVVLLTVRRCAFSGNSERFAVLGNCSYR